jgi:hypothetical protein
VEVCICSYRANAGLITISWLNRGSELSISDAKNRYKRLILKLSEVLLSEEVEGPYMHLNQRLVLI